MSAPQPWRVNTGWSGKHGHCGDAPPILDANGQPVIEPSEAVEIADDDLQLIVDAVNAYGQPAAVPSKIVTLPYGWHIVPRHLPDEVLEDVGAIEGYARRDSDENHRVWWGDVLDALALRVPVPILAYTQAQQPAAAVPAGWVIQRSREDVGGIGVVAPDCDPGGKTIFYNGSLERRLLYRLCENLLTAAERKGASGG